MSREQTEDPFAELECNQAALRKNIEISEELIARSDRLIERHRAEQVEGPANDDEA